MKPSFSTIGTTKEAGRTVPSTARMRISASRKATSRVFASTTACCDDADPAVVQRGHDLVGEPAVGHAALDLAPVRREQDDLRRRRGLGVRQSLLAVRHGVGGRSGRSAAAARRRGGCEALTTPLDVVSGVDCTLVHETLRRDGKLVLAAAQQDDGELVAGEPRHGVAAPHDGAQAPCDEAMASSATSKP